MRDRLNTEARWIGDRKVFPIALGTASWSLVDLRTPPEHVTPQFEARATAAIHTALECGVNLFDTARAYTTPGHPGHSEQLLARALKSHPAGVNSVVATKAGHERVGLRFPDDFPIDTRASAIRRHVQTSLELLELNEIWLLQLHWPPVEDSMTNVMETFADLLEEGLVRHVGICNVSQEQVAEARSVVRLASVQNQFSPFNQQDIDTVDYCAEQEIAYLAYSPLGGARTGSSNLASAFPRADRHAQERGVSIQTLALAWLLALSPTVIPISGASSSVTVRASAEAAAVALSPVAASAIGFSQRF